MHKASMHILWYRKHKNPPFSFIFIYNTDHIKFMTFKNIWHILYILFAYVILRHLKKLYQSPTLNCSLYFFWQKWQMHNIYFCPFFCFVLTKSVLPWNPMMKIWYEAPVVSNKNHWSLVSTDNRSGNSDVWEDLTRFCGCVALVAFPVPFSDTVSVPHRDFAAVTADMNRARVSRLTVVSESSAC